MAYITNSNAKRIISKISVAEKKKMAKTESEPVYKKQQIFFLSDLELGELLVYKKLCEDPERFTKWYQKIEVVDNYQYVFEGKTPSYHHFIDCTGLTSTFKNYKLPKKIKEQGKSKIKEFRDFVIKNQSLLEDPSNRADRDKFGLRLKMKFDVNPHELEVILVRNSGVRHFENFNLSDLEKEIDELLRKEGRHYNHRSKEEHQALYQFRQRSFLGDSDKPIYNNNTELEDEELKKLLRDYHLDYKRPVIDRLEWYFQVKYNPKLQFKGSLLDAIGFSPCSVCSRRALDEINCNSKNF